MEKRADAILKMMSLEDKIDYIGGFEDFYIRALPKYGLPTLKMADGPFGVRNYGPSTTVAGGIGLAATWDPAIARRVGAVIGDDARARGVHFMLGPGVNIYRAPMGGRDFEYFGEDPFLASRIAVGYIEGMQAKDVCATIKHFMGNNSEYDRHNTDSIIDERTMREIYLPTFEAAVKEAHVCSIMDSYNLTNGEHMTQNDYLNNQVVKKQWGFDGILMSDWVSTYDGVAAANGGLDLEMPSGKFMNRATLLPAITQGKVSEATIDDHVRRILRKAIQFGWFDQGHSQTDLSVSRYNPEGRKVALEAARGGIVLLKNEGTLLPLDKAKIKTLAVVGPGAHPGQPVGGGSADVHPFAAVSLLEGLANYLGDGVKVMYDTGISSPSDMAVATNFVTEASGGKPGLKVEYFKSTDLTGSPSQIATVLHVNGWRGRREAAALPPDVRSTRWTGYYIAPDAGNYEVFMQGVEENSGGRLFVDDRIVLDDWTHATLLDSANLQLTAGAHKIRLEFFRTEGGEDIRMGIVSDASVVHPEAKALAAQADAVVLAVGFDPRSESEGSDRSFHLPVGQDELVRAVLAANKKTVVVITSGGGTDLNAWLDQTPALLQSWYSGQEGGTALAQLLFGDYSPSGKLPVSFDRRWQDSAVYQSYYPNVGPRQIKYTEGVFLGYRSYDKRETRPLFPFGYGLSYTTFQYANLSVSPQNAAGDQSVTVSFDITNTGNREGAEVAELYVGDTHSAVPRPVKELKGFAKVELQPGESRKITLTLDRRAFSYYDVNGKQWKVDPGEFAILVGGSSDNIQLKGSVHVLQ